MLPSAPHNVARVLALILLIVSILGWYRVRAEKEADQFLPVDTAPVLVPAGTVIPAVVHHSIRESAEPGEEIVAFVEDHVVIDGRAAVPSGTQLKGIVEKVRVSGTVACTDIRFDAMLLDDVYLTIEADAITARIPVQSDTEILAAALRTLMGATMGAAIGAGSNDPRLVDRGLIEGTATSTPEQIEVPIAVTLARLLEIRNPRPASN
jgi:hypothetical protein